VIQSRFVKWFVVAGLLGVATYFVVNAKPARRVVAYLLAGAFAAPAVYVLARVHPREAKRATKGSILGDVESFLVCVPDLAQRFQDWAKPRGLHSSADPKQFLEWLWKHREAVGTQWDALLPLVAAAYGEVIRKKDPRARWAIRSGDAVVEIPGRPWLRTRVAHVVHETVFLDI
jgi:hypothetical protein